MTLFIKFIVLVILSFLSFSLTEQFRDELFEEKTLRGLFSELKDNGIKNDYILNNKKNTYIFEKRDSLFFVDSLKYLNENSNIIIAFSYNHSYLFDNNFLLNILKSKKIKKLYLYSGLYGNYRYQKHKFYTSNYIIKENTRLLKKIIQINDTDSSLVKNKLRLIDFSIEVNENDALVLSDNTNATCKLNPLINIKDIFHNDLFFIINRNAFINSGSIKNEENLNSLMKFHTEYVIPTSTFKNVNSFNITLEESENYYEIFPPDFQRQKVLNGLNKQISYYPL